MAALQKLLAAGGRNAEEMMSRIGRGGVSSMANMLGIDVPAQALDELFTLRGCCFAARCPPPPPPRARRARRAPTATVWAAARALAALYVCLCMCGSYIQRFDPNKCAAVAQRAGLCYLQKHTTASLLSCSSAFVNVQITHFIAMFTSSSRLPALPDNPCAHHC